MLFHEACGHGLEADAVFKHAPIFAGRIGERVAADIVSAYDDPHLTGVWGSYHLDDEGTPAKRTPLIEQRHTPLLHQRQETFAARRCGGNRQRAAPDLPAPADAAHDQHLHRPGRAHHEDILADTQHGVYAKKLGGGEVNPVTGDFIFSITEGYMVEDGRLADPIKGATLVGNGPRVLENIDAVAADLDFDAGMCGKDGQSVPVSAGQPTLRVREMVVGGTAEVE